MFLRYNETLPLTNEQLNNGCSAPDCPFNEFKNIVKENLLSPQNYDGACGGTKDKEKKDNKADLISSFFYFFGYTEAVSTEGLFLTHNNKS